MKRTMHLSTTLALVLSLTAAMPAMAFDRPSKEVKINEKNLAKLAPAEQQEVLALKTRLEELIATDKSTLTSEERAALRTEWKELKNEMKEHNAAAGGSTIYISTAGLIIIILLLIIIL